MLIIFDHFEAKLSFAAKLLKFKDLVPFLVICDSNCGVFDQLVGVKNYLENYTDSCQLIMEIISR